MKRRLKQKMIMAKEVFFKKRQFLEPYESGSGEETVEVFRVECTVLYTTHILYKTRIMQTTGEEIEIGLRLLKCVNTKENQEKKTDLYS